MNKIIAILIIIALEKAAASGVQGGGGNGGGHSITASLTDGVKLESILIEADTFTAIERNIYDEDFISVNNLGELKVVASFTTIDGQNGLVVRSRNGNPGMILQDLSGYAWIMLDKN